MRKEILELLPLTVLPGELESWKCSAYFMNVTEPFTWSNSPELLRFPHCLWQLLFANDICIPLKRNRTQGGDSALSSKTTWIHPNKAVKQDNDTMENRDNTTLHRVVRQEKCVDTCRYIQHSFWPIQHAMYLYFTLASLFICPKNRCKIDSHQ